ncbi:LOW QUALITY PROTEIN: SCO-spondin-like [Molossus nigricans]
MEAILVEEEVPRQEDLVPCTSLYHYLRLGWWLDPWSGRAGLCAIYKPPETRPDAGNRTVRACCPGWGAPCTPASSPQGHCFATWQCQPRAGSANASAGSLEECCAQPRGHSWQDDHSPACLCCSGQQLPGSTPSPALLQPLAGAAAQLWSHSQRPSATCATWSGFHYRTFDGCHYHFLGRCCDSSWAVHLRPRDHCQLARGLMGPGEVLIPGGNISVNGQLVPDGEPQLLPGLSLQWGDWLVLSGGLGVVVQLDRSVSVDHELQGQTPGLCGVYNGQHEDDFLEPGGGLGTFGNSWRLPDSEPGCLDAVEAAQGCEESLRGTEGGMEAGQLRAEAQDNGEWREGPPLTPVTPTSECSGTRRAPAWPPGSSQPTPGPAERPCPGDQLCSGCTSVGEGGEGSGGEECVSSGEPPPPPPGLCWEGALCVPATRCPCYPRQRYASGDTVRQPCWRVPGPRWLCAQAPCPSECSVGGDHTFDGRSFSSRGSPGCRSILVQDLAKGQLLTVLEHGACDSGSCLHTISVILGDTTSSSGTQAPIPGAVWARGRMWACPGAPEGLSISQASSLFLLLRWPGAQVLWGVSDPAAYITLDRHAHQVRGLCGTFTCTHTQHHVFAETARAILHGPTFQECHRLVDRAPFHLPCLAAMCGCAPGRDCLCPALAAHAHRCAQEDAPSAWRNQTLCHEVSSASPRFPVSSSQLGGIQELCRAVPCPGGQEYQECAPVCDRNCGEPEGCGELGGCVAGCNCHSHNPSGLLWDPEGRCVPPSLCPCQLGAHRYAPGSATVKDCSRCVCQDRGLWNCTALLGPQRASCPHELVYVPGACLLTCDSPGASHPCAPGGCVAGESGGGCIGHCPPPWLFETGERCVPPELCPCRHGGRWYPPNATIHEDCNILCPPPLAHCVCQGRQCSGRCQASGAPHDVKFDGLALTFPGACKYLLVEASGQFTVSAQNLPCGASGPTCTEALTVLQSTVVHMLRGRAVMVKGVSVTPPKVYTPGLSLRSAGLFLLLTTRLGLTLLWDGGTRVLVQLCPQFRGRVAGQCGDFDGDARNDLRSCQGVLEPIAELTAHSWRHPLCPEPGDLPHPCTVNAHRAAWAHSCCGVLRQPLAQCHTEAPPQRHYEGCVYDACGCDCRGDRECLCSAIATYADECSWHGLHVRWRSQELCPLQCEGGQVYEACGPTCPPTCHDRSPEAGWHCQAVACVEGCFCPDGTLLHELRLIPGHPVFGTCKERQWLCGGDSTRCEEPVPGCAEGEPRQESGHCVPNEWLCDNQDDCGDGSDEEAECCATPGCREGQMSCSSGHCLPLALLCDGPPGCPDAADEESCLGSHREVGTCGCVSGGTPNSKNKVQCPGASSFRWLQGRLHPGEVSCDGTCVGAIQLCDGIDCPDGADEGPGHCPLPSLPPHPTPHLSQPLCGLLGAGTNSPGQHQPCGERACGGPCALCAPPRALCQRLALRGPRAAVQRRVCPTAPMAHPTAPRRAPLPRRRTDEGPDACVDGEPCRGTMTRPRQCHPPQNGGQACSRLPGGPPSTGQSPEWKGGGRLLCPKGQVLGGEGQRVCPGSAEASTAKPAVGGPLGPKGDVRSPQMPPGKSRGLGDRILVEGTGESCCHCALPGQSVAPGPFPPTRCSPGQVLAVLGFVEREHCDGRKDCLGSSDERRLVSLGPSTVPCTVPTLALPGLPASRALCPPRQLTCGSGERLPTEQRGDLRLTARAAQVRRAVVCARPGGTPEGPPPELAPWSGRSPCSLGTTFQRRERLRPPLPGGSCPPAQLCRQPCLVQACPVAGACTEWEAGGPHSVSCGGGHRSRQRSCPPPKNGGAPCPRGSQERTPCGLQPCTEDTGCMLGRVHVTAALCQEGLVPLCPPSCLDPEADRSCSEHCLEGGGELTLPAFPSSWTAAVMASVASLPCSMCERGVLLCEPGGCPCLRLVSVVLPGALRCSWLRSEGQVQVCRSPSNPPAASGSAPCEGDMQGLQACHRGPGPTSGAPWSACSQPCLAPGGPGWRSRSRLCPLGNTSCPGEATQEEPCSPPVCPVTSTWGLWTFWSPCSAPCDGGIQMRGRSCSGSAAGDAECQGAHSQTGDCSTKPCTAQCPGDMLFPSAEQCRQEGGPCSGLCLAQGPGVECTSFCAPGCTSPGLFLHDASCLPRAQSCQEQGHVWEPGEGAQLDSLACGWSPCSCSCNVGIWQRFWAGTAPPAAFGGAACQGPNMEAGFCCLRPCQGVGGEWGPRSPCSVPFGGGFRNHTRGSGPNSPVDFSICGLQPWPVPGVCPRHKQWLDGGQGPASCAELSASGGTNQTCLPGCHCPPGMLGWRAASLPDLVGDWGLSCVSGLITDCTPWPCEEGPLVWRCPAWCCCPLGPRPGLCSGPEAEEEPCTLPACGAGGWGPWGPWSSWSRSCGGGLRACDQPPPQAGDYCEGPQAQGVACQALPCPVTNYSIQGAECSPCGPPYPRSCDDLVHCVWHCQPGCYCPGPGAECRRALCLQPGHCSCLDLLAGCGAQLARPDGCNYCTCSEGRLNCTDLRCPVPVPGAWSAWTACSQPCRGQTRTRARVCVCPAQHGGSPCPVEAGQSGAQHQREPCPSPSTCPDCGAGQALFPCGKPCPRSCPRSCRDLSPAGSVCRSGSTGRQPSCGCPPGQRSQDGLCVATTTAAARIPGNQSQSVGSELSSWETLEPGEVGTGPCDSCEPREVLQGGGGTCVAGILQCQEVPYCPGPGAWGPWGPWEACSVSCQGGAHPGCARGGGAGPAHWSRPCHTQSAEAGCPAGCLYRECLPGKVCPFLCAQVTGQVACFSTGCEEGCHCRGTFQHCLACVQLGAVCSQAGWLSLATHLSPATGEQSHLLLGPRPPPSLTCPSEGVQSSCAHGELACSMSDCSKAGGGFGPWDPWGPCSCSCGGLGTRTRSRHWFSFGTGAAGSTVEPLTGLASGWGLWSPWSFCSRSCAAPAHPAWHSCAHLCLHWGKGETETPWSKLQDGKENEGLDEAMAGPEEEESCPCAPALRAYHSPGPGGHFPDILTAYQEHGFCNLRACPVPGGWSCWSPWLSCQGGRSLRSRSCSSPPPKNGGAPCAGERHHTRLCNPMPCGEGCPAGTEVVSCANCCPRRCSDLQEGTACQDGQACQPGCQAAAAPRVCQGLSGCWAGPRKQHSSGGLPPPGSLEQDSSCLPIGHWESTDAQGRSWAPGRHQDAQAGRLSCTAQPCPPPAHCAWSRWSAWSACCLCGPGGKQSRFRCPPHPAGVPEPALSAASLPTPVPAWWPPPHRGGQLEAGPVPAVLPPPVPQRSPPALWASAPSDPSGLTCVLPVSGAWTPRSPCSDCPVSCGGGNQVRTRVCVASAPPHGGPPCLGPHTQTQHCVRQPCGGLLDACFWGPWGPCSRSCGPGLASGSGSCRGRPPCSGTFLHLDTQACYLGPCPGEGVGVEQLDSWSSRTGCSCQVLVQQHYGLLRPVWGGNQGGGAPCTYQDGCFRPCLIRNCSEDSCTPPFEFQACGSPSTGLCATHLSRELCQDLPPCQPGCSCPEGLLEQAGGCAPPPPSSLAVSTSQEEERGLLSLSGWLEWSPCGPCLPPSILAPAPRTVPEGRWPQDPAGSPQPRPPLALKQHRHRLCGPETRRPWAGGPDLCTPPLSQQHLCPPEACLDLCQWSPWGPWSPCQMPCSGGFRLRWREAGGAPGGGCWGPWAQTELQRGPCPGESCETRDTVPTLDCANQCPRSCAELWDREQCLQGPCRPGCRCPPGRIVQDGRCVPIFSCLVARQPQCLLGAGPGRGAAAGLQSLHLCQRVPGVPNGSLVCPRRKCPVLGPWLAWSRCLAPCGGGTKRPPGQVLSTCATSCPCLCSHLWPGALCVQNPCQLGCGCPGGQLLHNGTCVPPTACPCTQLSLPWGLTLTLEEQAQELPSGTVLTQNCRHSICQGGAFSCSLADCQECPPGEMWQQVQTRSSCSVGQAAGSVYQRGPFRSPAGPCVTADLTVSAGAMGVPTWCLPAALLPSQSGSLGSFLPLSLEAGLGASGRVPAVLLCLPCPTEEQSASCRHLTELRNHQGPSPDPCYLDQVEVSCCRGHCPSSTDVMPEEPYLQSQCTCCSYRLDPENPVRILSLRCAGGHTEPVVLPDHSCPCTCQGGSGPGS